MSSLPTSSCATTSSSPLISARHAGTFCFDDPSSLRYWKQEEKLSELSPVVREARILSLSDDDDAANRELNRQINLPDGARLLAVGGATHDFDLEQLKKEEPNVLFVSHPLARKPLGELLQELPSIEWVHVRSAGIDFITSPELTASSVYMTNAKGQFSSTLAEYTMMACSFFAKDLPRLMKQKADKDWTKYPVQELRGSTMGVIGYGDIGKACAKLAKAYGMRVIALRRNPQLAEGDPYCDQIYGSDPDALNKVISASDYILCAAPLTEETRGLVGKEQLATAKRSAVFINLGRGPVVDEIALIDALRSDQIKGAALDVFTEEPLPESSQLWNLDNVLLSPHNMDMTATFMHEATEFFVYENLPRFLRGEQLLNLVDKAAGY